MKKGIIVATLGLGLLVALAALGTTPTGETPRLAGFLVENRKFVCMMQDSLQVKEGIEHAYGGKKYYLCCEGCVAGFDREPEKFSRAVDPVNGKTVDKAEAPIYGYGGRAYFFSSNETLVAFAKEPARYATMAQATRR